MLRARDFPDTRPSLLATLRGGSEHSGWREFYEHYAPAVYRVTRIRGLDTHDGEDIVQQVMVAIARHIDAFEYDSSRGHFRNWVRRVTERKIADMFRRRPRETADSSDLPDRMDDRPSVDEIWEREWHLQDMQACLKKVARDIAPRRLAAFRTYVLEGVSAAETAERFGLSIGHVYVIRHTVLNLLRDYMGRLDGESRH